MTEENDLNYKGGNPGASKYGNFINYYQFHPPGERINLLPKDLWKKKSDGEVFHGLDLGCNAGELTAALQQFLTENVAAQKKCRLLGVDIDPTLISRATEKYHDLQESLEFNCLDFMNETQTTNFFNNIYLKKCAIIKFDAVFCFSVTMWIHLNHGDEGLKRFLRNVAELGKILVMEPQPWKCYKSAEKRMKLSGHEFPCFKQLKIRQNVEEEIETYLVKECKCLKILESERTKWGRKLLFFNC